jgi:hypothetical protein
MTVLTHHDFETPGWGEFAQPPASVPGFADEVLADGPAGFYRFSEDPQIDVPDASGAGMHATAVGGGVVAAAGLLTWDGDPGAEFLGDGSYVHTPLQIDPSTGVAFSCWLELPPSLNTSQVYDVLAQQDGSGAGRTWLSVTYENSSFTLSTIIGNARVFSQQNVQTGRVYHVAFSVEAGGAYHWVIDGAVTATGTITPEFSDGDVVIGIHKQLSFSRYEGLLDEVAIFDAPLSVSRLRAHFQAGAKR